jgi:hypothetical protein
LPASRILLAATAIGSPASWDDSVVTARAETAAYRYLARDPVKAMDLGPEALAARKAAGEVASVEAVYRGDQARLADWAVTKAAAHSPPTTQSS